MSSRCPTDWLSEAVTHTRAHTHAHMLISQLMSMEDSDWRMIHQNDCGQRLRLSHQTASPCGAFGNAALKWVCSCVLARPTWATVDVQFKNNANANSDASLPALMVYGTITWLVDIWQMKAVLIYIKQLFLCVTLSATTTALWIRMQCHTISTHSSSIWLYSQCPKRPFNCRPDPCPGHACTVTYDTW